MSNLETTERLFGIIKSMDAELEKYRISPTANNFVIQLKQKLIDNLLSIHSALCADNTTPIVAEVQDSMGRLLGRDPNLNSFIIRVNLVENADKTGFITVNAYI